MKLFKEKRLAASERISKQLLRFLRNNINSCILIELKVVIGSFYIIATFNFVTIFMENLVVTF